MIARVDTDPDPASESEPHHPTAEPRRRRRPLMLLALGAVGVMLGVVGAFVAFGLARLIAGSERLTELRLATLDEAYEKWQKCGPADYDIAIRIGGPQAGEAQVEVRGGQVTRMTRDGKTPNTRSAQEVWAVPGMFKMLDQELDLVQKANATGAAALRVEFDRAYGFPRKYRRYKLAEFPEIRWDVTKFTPVPASESSSEAKTPAAEAPAAP